MVHVSVKAEEIFSFFGLPITNSMILSWFVMGIFLLVGIYYSNNIHKRRKPALFYLIQTIFNAIFNLIKSVLHEKAFIFFPILGAYFFYILMNNWVGILPTVGSLLIKPMIAKEAQVATHTQTEATPTNNDHSLPTPYEAKEAPQAKTGSKGEGGHGLIPLLRANTADLNTTFALALITVFLIQYYGFKYNGLGYLKKFINFSSPIMFFVGVLELISEVARILSFSFRLFGNVLAGEILITIVAFLLPPAATFIMAPFFALEIMAGAIQALVFMMLSTVLISMATAKAHH